MRHTVARAHRRKPDAYRLTHSRGRRVPCSDLPPRFAGCLYAGGPFSIGISGIGRGKDLAALGLSREEAIALAKENLARPLRPMRASAEIVPDGAFGSVDGDGYYGASRLLLHDQWAELAAGFKGEMVVAVPDKDRIFFADSGDPAAMLALERAAHEAARKSERPISSVLLVWTPDGWREWQR